MLALMTAVESAVSTDAVLAGLMVEQLECELAEMKVDEWVVVLVDTMGFWTVAWRVATLAGVSAVN